MSFWYRDGSRSNAERASEHIDPFLRVARNEALTEGQKATRLDELERLRTQKEAEQRARIRRAHEAKLRKREIAEAKRAERAEAARSSASAPRIARVLGSPHVRVANRSLDPFPGGRRRDREETRPLGVLPSQHQAGDLQRRRGHLAPPRRTRARPPDGLPRSPEGLLRLRRA